MDERELDTAIDTAVRELVAREPSCALSDNVMVHVRENNAPARRPLIWTAAAASLVLCGGITIALLNRASAPARVIPSSSAAQESIAAPQVAADPPLVIVAPATQPARRLAAPRMTANVAPPAERTIDDIAIEPIETPAIALSAIEVPQLARETTSIDTITIEPLTIEPLSASND
jgi:hypothetical protein